jgi:rubrerythrin
MDILDFAINMEMEGNKYYTAQAEANKDTGLAVVFGILAEDELKHAGLIKEKKAGGAFSSKKVKKSEAENLFADKSQKISDITASPEQLDAYRFALEKEKESIDLYKELSQKAEGGRELFEFLIGEEEKHFKIINDMVEMLSRPKEWVESAEFGIREDY